MTQPQKDLTEIARILGEPVERISDMSDEMMKITQSGLLVAVTIRRFRGFSKLKARDIGLDLSQEEASLMDLGSKRLLPTSYIRKLNSIDVSARSLLGANGFRTPWGQFVPAARYPWIKRQLELLKEQYSQVAEEIVANYDRVKAEVLGQYEQQAQIAYRRKALLEDTLQDEEEYIEEYTSRISQLIPTRSEIESKFGFEIRLAYVPLSPTFAYNGEGIAESLEERKKVAQIEQVEALEQMNQDVLAQAAREKENLINDFMREMMVQLRQRTFLMMGDIKKSMDKNGRIHPKSVEALENWRTLMLELNAYGNTDIERLTERVKEVTLYTKEQKADRFLEIGTLISDISTTVSRSLTDLGVRSISGKRKDDISIPVIDDMTKDRARTRLGLTLAPPPSIEVTRKTKKRAL